MNNPREGLPESVVIPRELIEQAIRYMAPEGLEVGDNMRRHVAAELLAALSQPAQGGGEVPQDAVLWALGTRVPEEVRARYGYPVHYTVADYMAGDTDENMLVMRTVLESVAGQFPASAALPHPQPEKGCKRVGYTISDASGMGADEMRYIEVPESYDEADVREEILNGPETWARDMPESARGPHIYMNATPPPPSDAAQGVQAVRVDELIEVAKAAAMKIQHNKEPWFPMTDRRLKAALLVALRAHKGEGNG
jgi:hypothetical protein